MNPLTRTNIRGEPMSPAFLRIIVRRERASGVSLVFATINFEGMEPRFGDWSERRETWLLAPAGRLRVEIVTESRAQMKETHVFLDRRD